MASPLSKNGSSTRLNANSPIMGSPGQAAGSTMTPYAMNTTTTTTGTTPLVSGSQINVAQLAKNNTYSNELPIFREIGKLESLISGISKSITGYKSPEFDQIKELVATVDSINTITEDIKNSTRLQKEQSLKLNQSNIELNQLFKDILLELKNYRKILSELPTDSSTKIHDNTEVSTEMLLEYALKLSKFSKIPKMIDTNITASNFVWPGEDSLRRGVLAMVSNDPSKFVDTDLLQVEKEVEIKAEETLEETKNVSDDDELNDFEDVNTTMNKRESGAAAVEGLDLFDSDEDDD